MPQRKVFSFEFGSCVENGKPTVVLIDEVIELPLKNMVDIGKAVVETLTMDEFPEIELSKDPCKRAEKLATNGKAVVWILPEESKHIRTGSE